MNKQNLGKTIYIINLYTLTLLEGVIVDVKEHEQLSGRTFLEYVVETNSENEYNKNISLYRSNYKNTVSYGANNFYFVKDQAIKALEVLKAKKLQDKIKADNTVKRKVIFNMSEVKGKTREEILASLLATKISEKMIQQSQFKHLCKKIDDIIELSNKIESLKFDFSKAFISEEEDRRNIVIDNLTLAFYCDILFDKLLKAKIYLTYKIGDKTLFINIKKWSTFFN